MIQVYHLMPKQPLSYPVARDTDTAKRIWRNEDPGAFYQMVALVSGSDLDIAFEKTNHIEGSWTENLCVDATPGIRQRSTSVGDVMVDGKGVAHLVAPIGFEVLEF